jgi:hypothetical protein
MVKNIDKMIKLSSIKSNPDNPRVIKDDEFKKLCKSIREFPKMMELRPIILNETSMVMAGNMRLKALTDIGYKEIPNEWVKKSTDLSKDEWNEFIIKDNISFGSWNFDLQSNQWDKDKIEEWGVSNIKDISELKNGEEVILDNAIQLKPQREYVVIMCNETNDEWEDIKKILSLKIVKKGGSSHSKIGNKTGISRVITAKQFIHAIRSTK